MAVEKKLEKFIFRSIIFALFIAPQLLAADEFYILEVVQSGKDIGLSLNAREYVNHPQGNSGRKLFAISDLDQYQLFDDELNSEIEQNVDLSVQQVDKPTYLAALKLNQAGILFAKHENNNLKEILSLYEEVARLNIEALDISDFARFQKAKLNLENEQYQEALDEFSKIKNKNFCHQSCYRHQVIEAMAYFGLDRYTEALDTLLPAVDFLSKREANNPQLRSEYAEILSSYGFLLVLTGKKNEGKKFLDEALIIALKENATKALADIHNNLGGYYNFDGNYVNAAEHLNYSIAYYFQYQDYLGAASAIGNLSQNYRRMGQYSLARQVLNEAQEILAVSKDDNLKTFIYEQLTATYLDLGEFEIAEKFGKIAVVSSHQQKNFWRENVLKVFVAEAMLSQEKVIESIDMLSQALDYFSAHLLLADNIDEEDQTLKRVVDVNLKLFESYSLVENYGLAKTFLENAEKYLIKIKNSGQEKILKKRIAYAKAKILAVENYHNEAIIQYDVLIADMNNTNSSPMDAKILGDYLRFLNNSNNFERSNYIGKLAVAKIHEVRRQLDSTRLGPAWSRETYNIYMDYIDILFKRFEESGDFETVENAFTVLEQSRSFSLVETNRTSLIDNLSLNKITEDMSAIAKQRVLLKDDREISTEYFRLQEQYLNILQVVEKRQRQEILTLTDLQSRLKNNEAVLEFICLPKSKCYMLSIGRTWADVKNFGSFKEIEDLVIKSIEEIKDINIASKTSHKKVENIVSENLLLNANIERVYILANYPFYYFPMSVLKIKDIEEDLQFMIEDMEIVRIFSISDFFSRDQVGEKNYSYDISILADPDMRMFLADLNDDENNNLKDTRSWLSSLKMLPWTKREAEKIQSIFGKDKVNIMLGSDAN